MMSLERVSCLGSFDHGILMGLFIRPQVFFFLCIDIFSFFLASLLLLY